MNIKDELIELLDNNYAPYSHFPVACLVVMKDGKYFKGVNVENASYGTTICAERVAITSAVTAGYHKGDFDKLYIMTNRDNISSSCFLCRQVILEFFDKDAEIIFSNKSGSAKRYYVKELCPLPFDEEDLK